MSILRFAFLLICTLLTACGEKPGPKESIEKFFTLCSNGKAAEAYQQSATMFQMERSSKYFEARIRELDLHRAMTIEFGPLASRGNAVMVPTQFKRSDAEPLQLDISVIQENGEWRVVDARRPAEHGQGEDVFRVIARTTDGNLVNTSKNFMEPVAPVLPTDEQLNSLVEDALMKFNESIKEGNFGGFYDFVSDRWKYRGKDPNVIKYMGDDPSRVKAADVNNQDQRLTRAALEREFGRFITAKVDLSPIRGKKMILDEPAFINTDSILIVKGVFDTYVFAGYETNPTPRKPKFRLEFVREGAAWKVFGISVVLL